jgi:hypothetical protein
MKTSQEKLFLPCLVSFILSGFAALLSVERIFAPFLGNSRLLRIVIALTLLGLAVGSGKILLRSRRTKTAITFGAMMGLFIGYCITLGVLGGVQ